MNALPSWLVEASNGMLLIILMWMIIFDAIYLVYKLRECLSFRVLYVESKAAIALMVVLLGFEAHTFVRWWFRHMQNQGVDPESYRDLGIFLLVAGTAMGVWGGICWLKVIMPRDLPRELWFVLSAIAVGFGIVMAL